MRVPEIAHTEATGGLTFLMPFSTPEREALVLVADALGRARDILVSRAPGSRLLPAVDYARQKIATASEGRRLLAGRPTVV